jgi:hypothetical protein
VAPQEGSVVFDDQAQVVAVVDDGRLVILVGE